VSTLPAVSCLDLELRREGRQVLMLDHWDVHPGERWVVMGPNGCGKTSLALALMGRLFPWGGRLDILGIHAGEDSLLPLRTRIGFCGDALEPLLDTSTTCEDLVSTAFVGTLGRRFDRPSATHRKRAREELEAWGLGGHRTSPWLRLSLGQRKRTWLARALVPEPDLLILDEPCAGLDPVGREDLMVHLEALALRRPQLPIVLVTHHLEEIPSCFGHLLLLDRGTRKASGPLRKTLLEGAFTSVFGDRFVPMPRKDRWSLSRS